MKKKIKHNVKQNNRENTMKDNGITLCSQNMLTGTRNFQNLYFSNLSAAPGLPNNSKRHRRFPENENLHKKSNSFVPHLTKHLPSISSIFISELKQGTVSLRFAQYPSNLKQMKTCTLMLPFRNGHTWGYSRFSIIKRK